MDFYPKTVIMRDAAARRWLSFRGLRELVIARSLKDVIPALDRTESLVEREGLLAAGFVSYDAAPAFDAALAARRAPHLPLVWFGLYRAAREISPPSPAARRGALGIGEWRSETTRRRYEEAIAEIRRRIFAGDTYQINYTIRLRAAFGGEPLELFRDLIRAQPDGCGAFIETAELAVCSASPELFFRLDGETLISRPMKGTAPRGLSFEADERMRRRLRRSAKNRAENVMITDMVRNDMSRIAEAGSVRVAELFGVERHPSLWQMTSTVACRTSAPVRRIMEALFPCASITGAPKPMAAAVIKELESSPRKIYCGAMGFILPGRKAQFNVAIRTVLADKLKGAAEYGVGGGITWDSSGADEYNECLVKARVLSLRLPEFKLLETMLWRPGRGWFLLEKHLSRMRNSAGYFGFQFDEAALRKTLSTSAARWSTPRRARVLLEKDGRHSLESSVFRPLRGGAPIVVGPAKAPVCSADVFLHHKTTRREAYEQARASRPDCDEALLWNERGELTEAAVWNVALKIGGKLFTPPARCGLLSGTYREWLLERGKLKERTLSVEDAFKAEAVYLMNSVRGMVRAELRP